MLRDVFYAMGANTGAYHDFIQYSKKRVFGHATLVCFIEALLILCGLIFTMAIPYSQFLAENDGLDGWIDKNVPYFEIVDGYLECDEEYEYDSDEIYVFVSSNYEFSSDDLHSFGFWQDVILADYEKVITRNNGQIREYYYDDIFGNDTFTKDTLKEKAASWQVFVYFGILLIWVVWSLNEYFMYFFSALFYALSALIANKIKNTDLTFGDLYKITLYAKTSPVIMKGFFRIFGWDVLGFIMFAITEIEIIIAISKIATKKAEALLLANAAITATTYGYDVYNQNDKFNKMNDNRSINNDNLAGNNNGNKFANDPNEALFDSINNNYNSVSMSNAQTGNMGSYSQNDMTGMNNQSDSLSSGIKIKSSFQEGENSIGSYQMQDNGSMSTYGQGSSLGGYQQGSNMGSYQQSSTNSYQPQNNVPESYAPENNTYNAYEQEVQSEPIVKSYAQINEELKARAAQKND
ncbi:MAG: DUF1189 family protein [Firmicutes bacterium]|nr:DUF1189 family protein [Bacillota bacterium]